MVRAIWLLVLAACGAAASPPPAAPSGPTACARASDNMVQALLDRLARQDPVPTEEADALRNLIRERCEQDRWSAKATDCLIAMKQVADAEACAPLLTEAQQEALVRDQAARGPVNSAPASGSPASGGPASGGPGPRTDGAREAESATSQPVSQPPAAAPQPPPALVEPVKPAKAKDKPRPGDPDDGGE
jgi:hypothetical protein